MTVPGRSGPTARWQWTGLRLAFVGLGAAGAVVPAVLPAMAQLFDVPTAVLLRAVPLLFAGLFAGVVVAPLAVARIDAGRAVAVGALLQAAALITMAAVARPAGFLAAAAVTGLGFGLTESAATSLTKRLRATSSRALTGLTALTAAAATLTPIAVVVAGSGLTRAVIALAALPHLLAAAALRRRSAEEPGEAAADLQTPRGARLGWLAAALFCYVGAETVVSGWSASLTRGLFDLSPSAAALGTSAFWVLLMLGRLAGSVALDRGSRPASLLLLCQLGAASCLAAGALAVQFVPTSPLVPAALLGLAVALMGPCYALLLGRGMDQLPAAAAATVAARLVAAGAAGGATWAAVVALSPVQAQSLILTGAACAAMTASALTGRKGAGATRRSTAVRPSDSARTG